MSLVDVRNVRKGFGELEVLRDISFQVEKGEVVCLIGPSGSGKSTMLRCINLLEDIDDGEIDVFDQNISELKDINSYRRRVGMVFQQFNLFGNMDVLNNCMLAQMRVLKKDRKVAEARALQELQKVGLGDFVHAYPSTLSGGQKQRVAIARALVNNPDIVLADEPTGNLDFKTAGEIFELMREIHRRITTVFVVVTHDRELAQKFDRRIEIRDGMVSNG